MVCRKFWLVETFSYVYWYVCTLFVCTYVLAYAVTKYGVTLAVLGMSQEFKSDGIAVNALWPRTGK